MHDPYSLQDKLILITGAGTGIGQGIALEAARRGADVVLGYANSAKGANDAVEQIKGMGRRAMAIQANLGQVSDCIRLVDEAAAFLGGLDGLVNNAGVTLTSKFLDVTEDDFDRIYNLNIRGEFFCAQQAVRHMIKRGEDLKKRYPDQVWAGASIVNISSVHGFSGAPGHSVYAGTKGAINSFTRELATELCAMHIRANVLAPGSIEVPSYFQNDSNYTREYGNSLVPWGRIGLPQDCGYIATFLLSDASEFMTGHVLYFDGGLTAKMALPLQPTNGQR